jgi:hypothetical protein
VPIQPRARIASTSSIGEMEILAISVFPWFHFCLSMVPFLFLGSFPRKILTIDASLTACMGIRSCLRPRITAGLVDEPGNLMPFDVVIVRPSQSLKSRLGL